MERNSWIDCRFHNRNRSHDAQQLRIDVDFQFRSIDAATLHWRRSSRYSEIASDWQSQSVGGEDIWTTRGGKQQISQTLNEVIEMEDTVYFKDSGIQFKTRMIYFLFVKQKKTNSFEALFCFVQKNIF